MTIKKSPYGFTVTPLSPMQEGMYFHLIKEKNTVYLEQMLCDISGTLDLELVECVINKLIELHESLRTVFIFDKLEGCHQKVLPYQAKRLCYTDLSGSLETDYLINQKVDAEMLRNFDLSKEATRCELFKLADNRYVFLWTYHHIIMDSLSIRLLHFQFCQFYSCFVNGFETPDVEAPPYSLYLQWISNQKKDEAKIYWTNYLDGYAAWNKSTAKLPYKEIGIEPETVQITFDSKLRQQLEFIARRHNATVNSVMLAVWGTYLLHKFDKVEALFGCVVSGRMIRLRNVDKICGLFVNTIPVRITHSVRIGTNIAEIQRHLFSSGPYSYVSLRNIMDCGSLNVDELLTVVNFSIDDVRIDNKYTRDLSFSIDNIRYKERAHYTYYLDIYMNENDFKIDIHYVSSVYAIDKAEVHRLIKLIIELYAEEKDPTVSEILSDISGLALSEFSTLNF